jgi:uncharacterized membrane protein HdeD (DUF308 family)
MRSIAAPLVWRGILALVVGVVAVAWPGITIWAFVILFAVYAFLAAGIEATYAFGSKTAGPVAGHLLVAFLDVAVGVIALAWPDITALALALLVAAWAFVIGLFEVYFSFQTGAAAGERTLLGLTGLILIALGIVFSIRPDVGAVTIAEVYGLFSIIFGFSTLVIATSTRGADHAIHAALG